MKMRTRASRASGRPFRVGRARTGLGLFATEPIRKGAFIVGYRGVRISHAEAERREARGARYIFELNSRWSIDGSNRRNLARYANHSCRPNAESALSKGKLILRAIRPIKPGDEITYDYGKEYFDLFIRPLGCQCVKCRDSRPNARKSKG
jgi:SET domain-containing protein